MVCRMWKARAEMNRSNEQMRSDESSGGPWAVLDFDYLVQFCLCSDGGGLPLLVQSLHRLETNGASQRERPHSQKRYFLSLKLCDFPKQWDLIAVDDENNLKTDE